MSTTAGTQNTLLKVILAILLPPLAVYMERGAGTQLVISILLTICTIWTLGIVHALIVVL